MSCPGMSRDVIGLHVMSRDVIGLHVMSRGCYKLTTPFDIGKPSGHDMKQFGLGRRINSFLHLIFLFFNKCKKVKLKINHCKNEEKYYLCIY